MGGKAEELSSLNTKKSMQISNHKTTTKFGIQMRISTIRSTMAIRTSYSLKLIRYYYTDLSDVWFLLTFNCQQSKQ